MTFHVLPDVRPVSQTRFPFGPLTVFSMMLVAWKARQKRRADMAMLMRMEPQMLHDIGVRLVLTPYDGGSILQFHPAVLATTMNANRD